jgi:dihydroorotase
MQFDLVVRGGTVVSSGGSKLADIGINNGVIEEIGDLSGAHSASSFEAGGLSVLPGFIDTQVHFREPGLTQKEDLESGTLGAICGGVTTIFEMPNTQPATTSIAALQDKLSRAQGRAWCDYSFFVGASRENVSSLRELEMAPGTPGIKIFVGSSTGSLLVEDDELLEAVLQHGSHRCSLHSEDEPRLRSRAALYLSNFGVGQHHWLRDAEAATLATKRILKLAKSTGRPVHILHISTGDELPILAEAKTNGLDVTCEVTPQHLTFTAPEAYDRLGSFVQMNPPIREAYHREALWRGLSEGIFDVFGSDHAPHTLEEKARPYRPGHDGSPSGMPGVQTMPRVLLRFVQEGRLSVQQVIRMGCERPAELFGLAGKGRIQVGFDADLVVTNLQESAEFRRSEVLSRCGWSPYEGMTLAANAKAVFLRGQLAAQDGRPVGSPNGLAARFNWK